MQVFRNWKVKWSFLILMSSFNRRKIYIYLNDMRVVIKLGTSTLTDGTNNLSLPRMADLARQIAELRSSGHELLMVSSGAMASGKAALNFPKLPKAIPVKQMLSAVGQPRLMYLWRQLFEIYSIVVAQILLTREDLTSRRRYLNARNTLTAILDQNVFPIVNENDTVATEEIRFGDNDNLSALVSNLIDADMLILLTDQRGLLNADPRVDPEADLIPLIDTPDIDPGLWQAAGEGGALGSGGMVTKLQAADLARRSGAGVVIAKGSEPNIIAKIVGGEPVGTRFTPLTSALESRKRFILSGGGGGELVVDSGAVRALMRGGSLLPAGLIEVKGKFDRGNAVRVLDAGGLEIARGLVNYQKSDCKKLTGRQSGEIEPLLGYFYGDEIIHRSNLVLIKR